MADERRWRLVCIYSGQPFVWPETFAEELEAAQQGNVWVKASQSDYAHYFVVPIIGGPPDG